MKGLILSLVVFLLYVLTAATFTHFKKIRHYSKLFVGGFILWSVLYFVLYLATPPDLFFLPPSLQATPTWLDASYGYLVFALNFHNQIDFFFAVNTGFSMSVLYALLTAPNKTLSRQTIHSLFKGDDEVDKIYAWRLSYLSEDGYLNIHDDEVTLTQKGEKAARFASFWKRFLNLGMGG